MAENYWDSFHFITELFHKILYLSGQKSISSLGLGFSFLINLFQISHCLRGTAKSQWGPNGRPSHNFEVRGYKSNVDPNISQGIPIQKHLILVEIWNRSIYTNRLSLWDFNLPWKRVKQQYRAQQQQSAWLLTKNNNKKNKQKHIIYPPWSQNTVRT